MTKKRVTTLVMAMVFVFIMIFGLSGCDYKPNPLLEEGNFIYKIESNTGPGGKVTEGEKAVIYGLSEVGKTKKYIVVPETLGGHEVKDIGYSFMYNFQGYWESEVLEKVYFTKDYAFPNRDFLRDVEKIIKAMFFSGEVPDISYCTKCIPLNIGSISKMTANTTYYWNYENSPKEGIYWIDDWDNEKIDFIPQEPVREGFIFKGWYKDELCVEKWDFDNDVVPAKLYDETNQNKYIYVETTLYAKWAAPYDHE